MTFAMNPLTGSPGVEIQAACWRGGQRLMQERRHQDCGSPGHAGGENHRDNTPSLGLKGDSVLKCSCQNNSLCFSCFLHQGKSAVSVFSTGPSEPPRLGASVCTGDCCHPVALVSVTYWTSSSLLNNSVEGNLEPGFNTVIS